MCLYAQYCTRTACQAFYQLHSRINNLGLWALSGNITIFFCFFVSKLQSENSLTFSISIFLCRFFPCHYQDLRWGPYTPKGLRAKSGSSLCLDVPSRSSRPLLKAAWWRLQGGLLLPKQTYPYLSSTFDLFLYDTFQNSNYTVI